MGQYLDYAMGHNLSNRLPLWIKPDRKLDVDDVKRMMRDYYQDTPMDMTKDVGAGPYRLHCQMETYDLDSRRCGICS